MKLSHPLIVVTKVSRFGCWALSEEDSANEDLVRLLYLWTDGTSNGTFGLRFWLTFILAIDIFNVDIIAVVVDLNNILVVQVLRICIPQESIHSETERKPSSLMSRIGWIWDLFECSCLNCWEKYSGRAIKSSRTKGIGSLSCGKRRSSFSSLDLLDFERYSHVKIRTEKSLCWADNNELARVYISSFYSLQSISP